MKEKLNINVCQLNKDYATLKGIVARIKGEGLYGIEDRAIFNCNSETEKKLLEKLNVKNDYQVYRIFYAQNDMVNPNLEQMQKTIEPRIITRGNNKKCIDGYTDQYLLEKEYLVGLEHLEKNPRDYRDKLLLKILEDSKNLTLDSGSLIRKYGDNEVYDLPYRFAIAANNSKQLKGNAYINDEMPKLFEGMEEKELFEKLDVLTLNLQGIYKKPYAFRRIKGESVNFKIGDRIFKAETLGSGYEGIAYKLTDQNGKNPVAIKVYHKDSNIAAEGAFGSMAVHREASKAGCVDVAKFYIGNPLAKPVKINGEPRYLSPWQIVEYIDKETLPIDENGLKLADWLDSYNLKLHDSPYGNQINGRNFDLGLVFPTNKDEVIEIFDTYSGSSTMNNIFMGYQNGTTTNEYIDFLTKHNCA